MGIALYARLHLGEIGALFGIGQIPGREIGNDVALGEAAHRHRAIGVMRADETVAEQIAADDHSDRQDRGGHQQRAAKSCHALFHCR